MLEKFINVSEKCFVNYVALTPSGIILGIFVGVVLILLVWVIINSMRDTIM